MILKVSTERIQSFPSGVADRGFFHGAPGIVVFPVFEAIALIREAWIDPSSCRRRPVGTVSGQVSVQALP